MICPLQKKNTVKIDFDLSLKEKEFINMLFDSVSIVFSNFINEKNTKENREKMKIEIENETKRLLNENNTNNSLIKISDRLIYFIMIMLDCSEKECKYNSDRLCLTKNFIFIQTPSDEYRIIVKTTDFLTK